MIAQSLIFAIKKIITLSGKSKLNGQVRRVGGGGQRVGVHSLPGIILSSAFRRTD